MIITGFKKFVCWDCRNCRQHGAKCEFCGGPMHYMGHRWRPPRRNAVRQWKIQQKRWEDGRAPDGATYRWGRLVRWEWSTCRWCGEPMKKDHPRSPHG